MNVEIEVAVEIAIQAETMSARAHIGHRSLRRLLHHVAELSGKSQLAFAIDDGRFRAQDGAADFGPGETRDQSYLALFMRQGVAELDDAQEFGDVLARDIHGVGSTLFYDFACDLTADVANFALQIAYTSFARVGAD